MRLGERLLRHGAVLEALDAPDGGTRSSRSGAEVASAD
jgi:hypothetical protein